jgi:TrmH family RNA methyltransferase
LLPQFSKHVQIAVVSDSVFTSAVEVDHPQGVAALVRVPDFQLADVFGTPGVNALVVIAAGLQDPGNLGTLIRAADAFGATGVVTTENTVSPWNAKAVRASAGSLFHLPVVAQVAAAALVSECGKRGVRLLSTAARSPKPLAETDLRSPLCLLIGQEGAGVPRELQRAAAETVAVPMVREVESLNAGVAGAIILYEAARQRHVAV